MGNTTIRVCFEMSTFHYDVKTRAERTVTSESKNTKSEHTRNKH